MRTTLSRLAVYLGGLAIIMCAIESRATSHDPEQTNYFVYAGTYGKGIYGYRFDAATGKLDALGLVGEVVNPSFLAADNDFRFLYAVSEVDGDVNGGVAAFSIDRKNGSLKFLNSGSSGGVAPCHLVVDRTARALFVANYGTGGISVFPIEHDGRLGARSALMEAHGSSVNPERQKGPHAHEVVISAENRFLYVPDLGLDQIRIYRIDAAQSKLTPSQPPFVKEEPGLGPRHMALCPNGRFAYVINELKSVITVFSHDTSTGDLKLVQTVSTVPPGFSGQNAPAEILIDRQGKFLYASNRGDDSIAVFAIDEKTGTLRQIQIVPSRGKEPRGVEIDPTGRFLFVGNHKSDQFVIFRINQKTGELDSTGQLVNVTTPVAFQFVPAA